MDGYGQVNSSETDQARQDALVKELAKVFHEPEDARRLAMRAGIPKAEIPAFSRPSVFWPRVIEHAQNGGLNGGMETIRTMAAEKFPGNAVFTPRCSALPRSQYAHEDPPRLPPGSTGGVLHVLLGMLLMALMVSTVVLYTLSGHSSAWAGTFGDTAESGDDASSKEDAVPLPKPPIRLGDITPPQPVASATWSCVSFRSRYAHPKNGRQTTCRAEKERCLSIRKHQASQDKRPSECIEVSGEHPAEALKTSRERWRPSEVQKQGIDGWLYPYGDLISG